MASSRHSVNIDARVQTTKTLTKTGSGIINTQTVTKQKKEVSQQSSCTLRVWVSTGTSKIMNIVPQKLVINIGIKINHSKTTFTKFAKRVYRKFSMASRTIRKRISVEKWK